MKFENFNYKIQQQFAKMCNTGRLFRSSITGDQVWEAYLFSFEHEKVFRDPESSEHNCNSCKNFIRRYGNIVAIDSDGKLISMFSGINDVGEYTIPAFNLANLLENSEIENVFFESYHALNVLLTYESCKRNQEVYQLGFKPNFKQYTQEEANKFGVVDTTKVYEFAHFNVKIPKQFIVTGNNSLDSVIASYRDKYNVFKRAMEEIPLDTLELVKDLINQGSLLDGTTHLHSVEEFITAKVLYNSTTWNKDNWLWSYSSNIEERTAKFKNTLIGVLCTELAEGMDLNKACENWNKRVDPVNYHKVSAPITQRQIAEAKKFVEENGYEESFDRRLATIDDIKADEILHLNSGDGSIKKVSVFDTVKSTSTRHKRAEFDKVEEVSIDKFMKDILPSCTSVEAYVENRMQGNLVTMTKAVSDDSKPIFKWDNNYSWTFNGNLAGKSMIKEAVKSRAGNVDAAIRISLFFPDTTNDYDLHVTDSDGYHIYYGNIRKHAPVSKGILDLDAQGVDGLQPPEKRVENITFADMNKLSVGEIDIWVHNYSDKGLRTPFKVEIEINGEITLLESTPTNVNQTTVGKIIIYKGEATLEVDSKMKIISSNSVTKEIWGIETNNFHKVNLICLSPNYWGNNKIGNLYYMFMLADCKCDVNVRGFHNENLIPDLLKHRKVMEVLGAANMIEPKDKQLSGLGFNSTVRDELIVRCKGNFNRVLKIKF